MKEMNVTGPIYQIQLHEMCEAVHSNITVRYREGNGYSFFDDHGTIAELCIKYKLIKRESGMYDGQHHIGRGCLVSLKEGKTIFERYY